MMENRIRHLKLRQNRISHSKLYLKILIPHYAAPFTAIMGYNSYLLPIPFQDLTFEVQRTLFRRFNRVELSTLCQVDDILPGAA